MKRIGNRLWIALLLIGAMVVTGGAAQVGAQSATPPPATPESTGVVREVLSTGDPEAAPGEALALVRYSIPAGLALPAHTHPGMQVSTIESGVLLYTVVDGEAFVTRAGTDSMEAITPESGETPINAGDALVEPEGMVHQARTAEPVVILTASLFESDEPTATLVTAEATPAP